MNKNSRCRKPHSRETKEKIAKGNTGKVFSDERKKNIGESRKIKLDETTLKNLISDWERGYLTNKFLMKKYDLSERVYYRLMDEVCDKTKLIKFLPQNLEPALYEKIIELADGTNHIGFIAEAVGLNIKQTKSIIDKLTERYNLKLIRKPAVRTKKHQEKVSKHITQYNKEFPKKREENPNWKGGVTELKELIKVTPEYKQWRKAVMIKSNYTCTSCGIKNTWLHAHHIKPFSRLLIEYNIISVEQAQKEPGMWEVSNGLTLCEPCHKETDSYGKTIKTREKQGLE